MLMLKLCPKNINNFIINQEILYVYEIEKCITVFTKPHRLCVPSAS